MTIKQRAALAGSPAGPPPSPCLGRCWAALGVCTGDSIKDFLLHVCTAVSPEELLCSWESCREGTVCTPLPRRAEYTAGTPQTIHASERPNLCQKGKCSFYSPFLTLAPAQLSLLIIPLWLTMDFGPGLCLREVSSSSPGGSISIPMALAVPTF